jgi:hypothetical protein
MPLAQAKRGGNPLQRAQRAVSTSPGSLAYSPALNVGEILGTTQGQHLYACTGTPTGSTPVSQTERQHYTPFVSFGPPLSLTSPSVRLPLSARVA